MELPDIGKQCSVPNCKQLDFLPLECSCKLIFCHEHFREHVEQCQVRKQEINLEHNTDNYYVCSEEGCSEKSIVSLICKNCNKHYCVAHRHITGCTKVDSNILQEAIDRCNAPKIQFQEAKAIVDQQVESSLKIARRKEKNVETANKVQLMRLKAKATGLKSIPVVNRLYFEIINKKYCPNGKPVFVSSDWTIGRAIDAIAEDCKIPNNNNKPLAAKLRLFQKNNDIISDNMADKMSDFIKNSVIINGESLFLDYVENK